MSSSSSSDEEKALRTLHDQITSPLLYHFRRGFDLAGMAPGSLYATALLTVVLGVAVLHFVEGWTLVSALYVIAQVVTTIGYGDITVTSDGMRLFMSFYTLWCLVLVAYALNTAVQNIVSRQMEQLKVRMTDVEEGHTESEIEAKERWEALYSVLCSGAIFLLHILLGTIVYGLIDRTPADCELEANGKCHENSGSKAPNLIEAFYMSIITLSTVGFGDYSPKSFYGRLFGLCWMCTGIASTASFINSLQQYIFNAKQDFREHETMGKEVFDQMDVDKSGYLTKGEFRTFILVKHGIVSQEMVNLIDHKYNLIDVKRTNKVTFDMVQRWQAENVQRREAL